MNKKYIYSIGLMIIATAVLFVCWPSYAEWINGRYCVQRTYVPDPDKADGHGVHFSTPDLIIENIDLGQSQVMSYVHNLGATPRLIRCVVVFKQADSGYVIGDEEDVSAIIDAGDWTYRISYGANDTEVWINQRTLLENWPNPTILTKDGGITTASSTLLSAKLYIWK